MFYLNQLSIIGNLTRDPEVRVTPNQQSVTNFAVATNRRYRDQGGNWVDAPPEYHEVVIWGQLGERCSQVLHKGDRIFASGRLQTRSWETPDGSKRYRTELVADTVIGPDQVNRGPGAAGSENSGYSHQDAAPATSAPAPKAASKPASAPTEEEIDIEDIPF